MSVILESWTNIDTTNYRYLEANVATFVIFQEMEVATLHKCCSFNKLLRLFFEVQLNRHFSSKVKLHRQLLSLIFAV